MPQKILTDHEWLDAVTHVVDLGRKLHKEVVLHTHFNHPNEITGITRDAMLRLFERGITVRNQSVLSAASTTTRDDALLVKRLGHVHVHPYYVYVHDMVKGAEDLRTTRADRDQHREARARLDRRLQHADVRGRRARRRRQARRHSYEHYDRTTGVSVFQAPSVKPGQYFLYFDPVDQPTGGGSAALGRPGRAPEDGRPGAGRRARAAPVASPDQSRFFFFAAFGFAAFGADASAGGGADVGGAEARLLGRGGGGGRLSGSR
jgi:lysine 2,3-aminomutase